MATRTSSQSGNFNSTSTWGGSAVPVDGDAFVVSAGHIVTVNDDRRTTNGFDNSVINGKLHITGSGKIRMNGQLDVTSTGTSDYFTENDSTTGAYFRMENGAVVEIKGDNSANHSFRVNNQKYNWVEIEGTNPNTTTTTSANVTIGSSSFTVTSGTGFAAGDWINVFRPLEDIDDWEYDRYQDEGMIIHDISGSTIYPRWFVSPTATISKVVGTKVFVDDAAVFRKGQQIIFGTGSNRNIRTISQVKLGTNILVVNSAPSGTVTGEKIYRCGTEKYHLSGHTVQKIATPLTADSSSGTNTITVASTAGMSAGDTILIEANNNSDTNWDYVMDYVISSISGNTITLTSNLGNNRYTGGWVTIYSRDTKFISTDIGNTSERPYIYFLRWASSDAYYRRYRIRNCEFSGIGSNSTNTTWYRGLGWSGYCSYENTSYGQYASGFEGNSWRPNNSGTSSCVYSRECHQCSVRNNIFYDGDLNFWRYSSGNNYAINNNISWRSQYTCFLQDGAYEPRMTIDYNHFSRSDDYGSLFYHQRNSAGQVRHNYWTHHEQRPMYMFYQSHNVIWENNYFNYFRLWPYIGAGGDWIHLNTHFGNDWDATTGVTSPVNGVVIGQLGDLRADRQLAGQNAYSINHNFRDGDTAEWGSYIWRTWDFDEGAWKVFRDTDNSGPAGINEAVFVPAGTTCYIAAEIKLSSGFSGTYPYIVCRQANSYHDGRHYENSTTNTQPSENTNYYYGFRESAQFTAAAIGAWERKTVTINAVDYDYYLTVMLWSDNVNAGDGLEHWHQRPIEMYVDGGSRVKEKRFVVHQQSRRGFNTSTTRKKKRLGGRLN